MIGTTVRRWQRTLLRERPWCDLCEHFGRHIDPASPDEGPRCLIWPEDALDEWNVHAEAVIQTWALITRLWPELPKVSGETKRPITGDTVIEKLKARYRVEDVARRITDLRGTKTLTGKCPLHREVNGRSFVVWPEIGRWRCYGACAKSGDVIDLWAAARQAGYRL